MKRIKQSVLKKEFHRHMVMPGKYIELPADLSPDEVTKRISNYVARLNETPYQFNPKAN